MQTMPEIILKPGREKSVLRRHPWIFSGAITSVNGSPKVGETVTVVSSKNEFLARAAYNPHSNIAGRIWTWDPEEEVDRDFFIGRLTRSIEMRHSLAGLIGSNAMRLVHAESDGVPGLVLDEYAGTCVVQFLTAGIEYWRNDIVDIIQQLTGAKAIYERSEVEARQLEGLPANNGLLLGDMHQNPVEIVEHGVKYMVDVVDGHKTGFYLDQRDNRYFSRSISRGRKILDCFAYTGSFAVNCLLGNAQSVTLVESSRVALEAARKNFKVNNLSMDNVELVEQDVFKFLRTLRDKRETFDLIILDPPKFASTAALAERAARGYKDINLLALKILTKGGYLLTFSCSGGVSEDLFQKIVAGSALDAGTEAVILKRLHQAIDHPVALNFPEGAYLKGFLVQKIS
jgi:23S rRNA (cytosine1962-C5)-methyltransferase